MEVYEGNGYQRDTSYHQGITWVWLLGLYYDGLKNMLKSEKNIKTKYELKKKIAEFRKETEETFMKEMLERGCIGSISEIYDSKAPSSIANALSFMNLGMQIPPCVYYNIE